VHLDLPRESAREELLRSLERLAAFQERVKGMVETPPT
jgi:hypothetical protein